MKNKPRKKRRQTKGKTVVRQSDLDYRALEAENLRLHREIAKLKAKHISEMNRHIVEIEQEPEEDSEALKSAREFLENRQTIA